MAYEDKYRLGVHGVFLNKENKVLLLKATYGNYSWGLPGGGVEPGETIHEALIRECKEELGIDFKIKYMSGVYFHKAHDAHACIFLCELPENFKITLSAEHSAYDFFNIDELPDVQRIRVQDCLAFDGYVKSGKF